MAIIVLANAAVLDVDAGTLIEGRHVVVEDGAIREVAESRPALAEARVIDLRGATLMPGLIDAHTHVTAFTADFGLIARSSPSYVAAQAARILGGMLRRGFTTVRDVGGADWGLARAVEEGLIQGPRLFYGGKALSQTGGHGDAREPGVEARDAAYTQPGVGVIVDGVPEVRRAARGEIRRGAHHIKIMGGGGAASPTDRLDSDQFSEEEIAAVVEEAAMANLYVVVHAYTPRTIERAARLGVRSIEHANYLDEPTAGVLKQRQCIMVPTLVTYHTGARIGREAGMTPDMVTKITALRDDGIKAVEIAQRAGIPMAYGTDLIGNLMHPYQADEFSLRREVVGAADLIRSATVVGAELIRMQGRLGRVAPGYHADLLAVRGNPLDNVTLLEDAARFIPLIIKAGEIVKSELN